MKPDSPPVIPDIPKLHNGEVKLFLQHVNRFRTAKVLDLVEDLLKAGFGDFLFSFDSLNPAQQQTFLKELKSTDAELRELQLLRDRVTKKKSGGLLNYLKFTRSMLQQNQQAHASKTYSWFIPPRYDLRPLEYAKGLMELSGEQNVSNKANPKYRKSINALMQMEEDYTKFESVGISAIKDIALVLVAGGVGERMQSKAAKVDRKVHYLGLVHNAKATAVRDYSFFEYYLETILALETHYHAHTGKKTSIPLLVMCAEHNHTNIMGVIKKYTGKGKLTPGQVRVCKQLLAPCLSGDGGIVMKDGKLMKKPLGHGYVHTLIHEQKYLAHLERGRDKKSYLFFLQDTNPQVVNTILSSLGMLKSHGAGFLWITVERHAGEAAGVIVGTHVKTGLTKLTGAGNKSKSLKQVINIEYNEIPAELNKLNKNLKTSPPELAANTNNFWITTAAYKTALKKTGGVLPYTINPKPGSDGKLKPLRPESLMQDIAKHLYLTPPSPPQKINHLKFGIPSISALTQSVTTVIYPRYLSFSPVKKPLLLPTLPTQHQSLKPFPVKSVPFPLYPHEWEYTALELEINHNLATLTALAMNNQVLLDNPKYKKNLSSSEAVCAYLRAFPKVILPPRYLLSSEYLRMRIKNCTFYPGSLLYIDSDEVTLDEVTFYSGSALIITRPKNQKYAVELRDLLIKEEGFAYTPIDAITHTIEKGGENYSEEVKNRGHALMWKNPVVISNYNSVEIIRQSNHLKK